jgi:hypothetical protein
VSQLKHRAPDQGAHIKTRDAPSINYDTLSPAFCLKYLRGEYCVTKCSLQEKADLVEKMHGFGNLTWAQMKCQPRHKWGCETIPRKQIKAAIPSVITDDVTILVMRFQGTKPMVGFREREVFHIIWLDRDFTLYDHGRR